MHPPTHSLTHTHTYSLNLYLECIISKSADKHRNIYRKLRNDILKTSKMNRLGRFTHPWSMHAVTERSKFKTVIGKGDKDLEHTFRTIQLEAERGRIEITYQVLNNSCLKCIYFSKVKPSSEKKWYMRRTGSLKDPIITLNLCAWHLALMCKSSFWTAR